MKKIRKEQWGYAGVWHGDFRVWDGDELMNKLNWVVKQGFHSTGIGRKAVEAPERFEQVADFVRTHGIRLAPSFHAGFFKDPLEKLLDEVKDYAAWVERSKEPLNIQHVHVVVGPYHRFMRDPSLEFQMERLEKVLTPLAAALHDLGIYFGIENHIDYYCSDLVRLCERVPHLGIMLDTGNCAGIGEKCIEGSREAAPYVMATHLKDFYLAPQGSPLAFIQKGATFGEGDVGLDVILEDILKLHPNPETIDFQWEWIPDENHSAYESIELSKEFCKRFTED